MRKMLGVALLAGCAQQAVAPAPELLVTPSDERVTADIVPEFSIEAAAGEQHVVAILHDRLETENTIQLAPTEHLFALICGDRVPLVEEHTRCRAMRTRRCSRRGTRWRSRAMRSRSGSNSTARTARSSRRP